MRALPRGVRRAWAIAAGLALTALAVVALSGSTHAVADSNSGDVWVDNVGQPAGPGHEQDPHLACTDINIWGNKLAASAGIYTVDGWPPSGAQKQDYPASGSAPWTYNTALGGDQVISVISVQALIATAIANGDVAQPQHGFHFKLEISQDPQKHKTFWVSCPAGGGVGGETSTPTSTPTPTADTSTATPTPTSDVSTPTPTPSGGVNALTATPTPGSPSASGVRGVSTSTPSTGANGWTLGLGLVALLTGASMLLTTAIRRRRSPVTVDETW